MSEEVKRDESGRFKKGTASPNPGGRGNSRGIVAYIKSISNNMEDYISILDTVVRDPKTKVSDKLSAIRELLDRSLGKSQLHVSTEGSLDIVVGGIPKDIE